MKNLSDLRREYVTGSLRRSDLNPDPIAQFAQWFEVATKFYPDEANAMTLATADKNGRPSARVVLLKGVDERGFAFFTQYEGAKGRELTANPNAALVFYWAELERQVCIGGEVAKLSAGESKDYFKTRPKGSRLAAWVSPQSAVVVGRKFLEDRMSELEKKYPGEDVPKPPYWGGFVLSPRRIEFWQGRPNRLHDRFLYTRQVDNSWQIERLAP